MSPVAIESACLYPSNVTPENYPESGSLVTRRGSWSRTASTLKCLSWTIWSPLLQIALSRGTATPPKQLRDSAASWHTPTGQSVQVGPSVTNPDSAPFSIKLLLYRSHSIGVPGPGLSAWAGWTAQTRLRAWMSSHDYFSGLHPSQIRAATNF